MMISTGILDAFYFMYDGTLSVNTHSVSVFVGIDKGVEPIYHIDMGTVGDKTSGFIFYEEE